MTLLMPPPAPSADTVTIHVPDHAGELVEVQAPRPEPHPAPVPPPKTFVDYLPWMLLVGLAALLVGLLAGMMIGPQQVVVRSSGFAPAAYGLAREHLAQAPAATAAISLAQEHLNLAPTGWVPSAYGLAREHLAQAPASAAAISLAQEHLNLAP